jgi:hypothetical protein
MFDLTSDYYAFDDVKLHRDRHPGTAAPLLVGLSGAGTPDPGEILNSPAYRLYERRVLPAETSFSGLWRGLLSFRIMLVGAVREVS